MSIKIKGLTRICGLILLKDLSQFMELL
jgi:hypothetical protein